MARKGGKDRGLFLRRLPSGKEVWCYRFWWHGREVKKKGGETKEQARRELRKQLADLEAGRTSLSPTRGETVAGALERFRPVAQRNRNYKKTQCFFAFWDTFCGKVALTKLTPTLIEQAQQQLIDSNKSPATVNRYMDFLRHVLNREVRLGHLHRNPVNSVNRMKEPKGKTRYLTIDEERLLLTAIGPIYAPWVRLAILTGLRQEEQFALQWTDVDLDNGVLALPHTKAGVVQYAPLNQEARDILRGFSSWETSNWVFPSNRNPKAALHVGNFYRRVYVPALRAAGLRLPTDHPDQRVDWHTLWHTFASRSAMQGLPEGTISALLRHSTTSLVKRYAHLSPAYLHSAVEEVSRFGRHDTRPTQEESAS